MPEIAPVVLFVYQRLDHLRKTIETLQKNDLAAETLLIVYSDAPAKPEHGEGVNEVRAFLNKITGFKKVEIIPQTENQGLAKSIVSGVTEQVNKFGRIIVLEDDLETTPHFLRFMNDALEFYKTDEKVMQVSGFTFSMGERLPETFLVGHAPSWGWATWKRAWDHLSLDVDQHIEKIKRDKLEYRFNVDDGMDFLSHLEANKSGALNTWAVKWYASLFLSGGLCLYPKKSLVRNLGHDGSGENCLDQRNFFNMQPLGNKIAVKKIAMKENLKARKIFSNFFRKMNGGNTLKEEKIIRVKDKIRFEIKKLLGKSK
ncbi:MAG: glycosyltransferase [Bacteroidetes bacterium]|nr:glycosyltransferase [Bacteroidota bacterium]